jgi:hypothetical protein
VQANTPGQHDGLQRFWVNDVLQREVLGMRWRDTTNLQLGAAVLSFSLSPAQVQKYWIDNIVVATQRIGCNIVAAGGPPAPPSGIIFGKYYLTVAKTGAGAGTVTGPGINCGLDCSEPYDPNTAVTLTATPSGTNTFSGWSGACAGTGSCVVTMSQARSVTASFAVPVSASSVTLRWTDTNTSPNETGTQVWRCVGDLCDPSTTGTIVANAASDAVTSTYTENSIGSVLGYSLRATGTGGNSGFTTPLYVSFHNGTCPCTIWPSGATPAVTSTGGATVELGLRFKSDVSGFIKGVRFYKDVTNTGAHTGSLWTAAGALLATGPFTSETASGWQQMLFSSPVAITAGTTYVVSYHTPGGFSSTNNYFASPHYGPPLHALANGDGGSNGLFTYGAGGFPTSTSNSQNYWVDVVFDTVP